MRVKRRIKTDCLWIAPGLARCFFAVFLLVTDDLRMIFADIPGIMMSENKRNPCISDGLPKNNVPVHRLANGMYIERGDNMTIDEMKERKRELGFTCQQLADLSGVPYATVQKIFGGVTKSPRRNTLLALERILSPNQPGGRWNLSENRPQELPLGDNPTPMDIENAANYGANINYMDYMPCTSSMVHEMIETYGTGALVSNDDSGTDTNSATGHKKKPGEYTLEDIRMLPDDIRVELIDGVIYAMASPSLIHQEIAGSLYYYFSKFIKDNHGPCKAIIAPFDIQLEADNDSTVEPDVIVVCDRDKIKPGRCIGAPDLLVEVLSPSSRVYDMTTKLNKYVHTGVREYWLVDPERKTVTVYFNTGSDLFLRVYTFTDKIPVEIWDGKCVIDFAEIYNDLLPLYEQKEQED